MEYDGTAIAKIESVTRVFRISAFHVHYFIMLSLIMFVFLHHVLLAFTMTGVLSNLVGSFLANDNVSEKVAI